MTCLSTEEEGDARLRSRSAFVRCSFRITAVVSSFSEEPNLRVLFCLVEQIFL